MNSSQIIRNVLHVGRLTSNSRYVCIVARYSGDIRRNGRNCCDCIGRNSAILDVSKSSNISLDLSNAICISNSRANLNSTSGFIKRKNRPLAVILVSKNESSRCIRVRKTKAAISQVFHVSHHSNKFIKLYVQRRYLERAGGRKVSSSFKLYIACKNNNLTSRKPRRKNNSAIIAASPSVWPGSRNRIIRV